MRKVVFETPSGKYEARKASHSPIWHLQGPNGERAGHAANERELQVLISRVRRRESEK